MRTLTEIGYEKFKRRRLSPSHDNHLSSVPTVNANDPHMMRNAGKLYDKYQILRITGLTGRYDTFVDVLLNIIQDYPNMVSKSLTIENGNTSSSLDDVKAKITSSHNRKDDDDDQWYMSFILQDDKKLLDEFTSSKLYQLPPFFPSSSSSSSSSSYWHHLRHTEPIWLFYGRNTSSRPYRGRVEHTDSVAHDGTWHYQVCGAKKWYVRPVIESQEWRYGCPHIINDDDDYDDDYDHDHDDDNVKRLKFTCHTNDILIINTRLWWHSTAIVDTTHAIDQLSVSYARDFYIDGKVPDDISNMTNVDGLYAANNVARGDIVLYEEELPDCSLPRDMDANCMVAELDDGNLVLIARKDIHVGDWLTVCPSDNDDDDECDYEEEECDD